MKLRTMTLLIAILCLLAFRVIPAEDKPTGKTIKPCVMITGNHSHVDKPRYLRITSADEWTRVWEEHKGPNTPADCDLLSVDFDGYMVIAIFQGNGVNSFGLGAVSITEEDKRIVLRYKKTGYQTGSVDGGDGGAEKVTVYGFFVLPRSPKPVVLEENVSTIIGQEPPEWKERKTFSKIE